MTTKERPILFSGAMVRAILEDRKTMTRRVVKPTMTTPRVAPLRMEPWLIDGEQETDDNGAPLWAGFHPDYPGEAKWFSCPQGKAGDRLWVRETWSRETIDGSERIAYRADIPNGYNFVGWRPSIFMPRWASRITLEVVSVRVERVQDITPDDVKAEGVMIAPGQMWRPLGSKEPHQPYTACQAFGALWDNINDKRGYSWESNPWVWCVSFRRLDANV